MLACYLCNEEYPIDRIITLSCEHRTCSECFVNNCQQQINAGINSDCLCCPVMLDDFVCGFPIDGNELQANLPPELYEKYNDLIMKPYRAAMLRENEIVGRLAFENNVLNWTKQKPIVNGSLKVYVLESTATDSCVGRETQEFNIAAGHFSRLLNKLPSCVTKVEVLEYEENSPVLQRYYQRKFGYAQELQEETWVFHGSAAIQKIAEEGFKVGGQDGIRIKNGAAHGNGVYTAKGPNIPMGYSKETKAVIFARGIKGKPEDHVAPNGDWIIFKAADQLLPCYIVHFTG